MVEELVSGEQVCLPQAAMGVDLASREQIYMSLFLFPCTVPEICVLRTKISVHKIYICAR